MEVGRSGRRGRNVDVRDLLWQQDKRSPALARTLLPATEVFSVKELAFTGLKIVKRVLKVLIMSLVVY